MICYPTNADATNAAMPRGSGHDNSQPAVTRDLDPEGPSRLRATNQLTYASASAFSLTLRDSYPAPGEAEHLFFPYQQHIPVNYAAPAFVLDDQVGYPLCPHDLAEYSPCSHRSIQVLPTIAGSTPPNPQQ